MIIDRATRDDIAHVARNMRQRDFEEFSALSWAKDREALVEELIERFSGRSDVLCASLDEPVCIGMTLLVRPRVVSLGFLATDRFPEIAVGVTRFTRALLERYEATGVHRIEALSLDGYLEAHRWLGLLGLEQEGPPLQSYGRDGEAFVIFARVGNAGQTGV